MKEIIKRRIKESIEVKRQVYDSQLLLEQITDLSHQILAALSNGKKVLFAGNGGSYADSIHLAGEFVSRFLIDRKPLPAIALGSNNSIITAIGNDYSFEDIFARELEALGAEGDIFIGLSTSGNSGNIIKAVEVAKQKGIVSYIFTGESGGKLRDICGNCICVPSKETPRIQEAHITIGHIICEIVEREFFKG